MDERSESELKKRGSCVNETKNSVTYHGMNERTLYLAWYLAMRLKAKLKTCE